MIKYVFMAKLSMMHLCSQDGISILMTKLCIYKECWHTPPVSTNSFRLNNLVFIIETSFQ
jgi:hypothetical protein